VVHDLKKNATFLKFQERFVLTETLT